MTIAFLTWLILVLHYIFIFDPLVDPLNLDDEVNSYPNSIDNDVLKWFSLKLPHGARPARRWERSVSKVLSHLLVSGDLEYLS